MGRELVVFLPQRFFDDPIFNSLVGHAVERQVRPHFHFHRGHRQAALRPAAEDCPEAG